MRDVKKNSILLSINDKDLQIKVAESCNLFQDIYATLFRNSVYLSVILNSSSIVSVLSIINSIENNIKYNKEMIISYSFDCILIIFLNLLSLSLFTLSAYNASVSLLDSKDAQLYYKVLQFIISFVCWFCLLGSPIFFSINSYYLINSLIII